MGVQPFSGGMRRRSASHLLLLIALLAALSSVPSASRVAASDDLGTAEAVPGQIVLSWDPALASIPISQAAEGALDEDRASDAWRKASQTLAGLSGLPVIDVVPAYGTALLSVVPGQESMEIERLSRLPWVLYAERNFIAHATGYPNDPFIGDQWNLRRIDAIRGWEITTGSLSIVAAVVDSGVDLNHPEFAGRILAGYDYANLDSYPADDYGHGTHVTGILAAFHRRFCALLRGNAVFVHIPAGL